MSADISTQLNELGRWQGFLTDVLEGKKPSFGNALKDTDKSSFERRAVRLLKHMFKDGYHTEHAGIYYGAHEEDGYLTEISSGGSEPPAPVNTLFTQSDNAARQEQYIKSIVGDNADVIAEGGDAREALKLTEQLQVRLQGDGPATDKPLVIVENGFWRPLLRSLGRDYKGNEIFEGKNIHSIKSLEALPNLVERLELNRLEMTDDKSSMLPPGATIALATKTREKIIEVQHSFDGINSRIIRCDAIANFKDPIEDKRTYPGNTQDKLDAGEKAIHDAYKADPDSYKGKLKERGIDPDNLYVMAEDSGVHLKDERIAHYMYTHDKDGSEVNNPPENSMVNQLQLKEGFRLNIMQFPGVEFGPVMNSALGEDKVWQLINHAMDMMDKEADAKLEEKIQAVIASPPEEPSRLEEFILNQNSWGEITINDGKVSYGSHKTLHGFREAFERFHKGRSEQFAASKRYNYTYVNPHALNDKASDGQEYNFAYVDRSVVSTSVVGTRKVSLDVEAQQQTSQYFSSRSEQYIAHTAQGAGAIKTTRHYLKPKSDSDGRTESQIPLNERMEFSPRGYAIRALQRAAGMRDVEGDIAEEYIASADHSIEKESDKVEKLGAEFLAFDGQGELQLDDGSRAKHWDNILENTAAQADAFVLMPRSQNDEKITTSVSQTIDDILTFFSGIVARQIHPRDMDKPFIVHNKQDDNGVGCWDSLLALYDSMRDFAMIGDQQRLMLKEVSSQEALEEELMKARQNHFDAIYENTNAAPIEVAESGKFNVAVFCSATAKNAKLNADAKQLGAFLADNNFGLAFGAADRQMMGAVREGYMYTNAAYDAAVSAIIERNNKKGLDDTKSYALREMIYTTSFDCFKQKGHKDKFMLGSSVKHIIETEADDPDNVKASMHQYYDAETIYDRMRFMTRAADAFAIIPGGAGTVQELAAILKMKLDDDPDMGNKEIVLLNAPIQINGTAPADDAMGFYTKLIELFGGGEYNKGTDALKELGVHVVRSMEDVQSKLGDIRKATLQQKEITLDPLKIASYYSHEGHVALEKLQHRTVH